jgi:hypothetical protein
MKNKTYSGAERGFDISAFPATKVERARFAVRLNRKLRMGPCVLLGVALLLLSGHPARATAYTWNATGTQSWNSAANWSPNTGFPSSAGDVADVDINITSNETINLNTAISVGTLNLGDTDDTTSYTIAAGTSGTLTMNNNGSGAAINELSTAKNDVISAGIVIGDSGGLSITDAVTSANTFSVSGGITGTGNLALDANSAGIISVTSASNSGTITNSGSGTSTVAIGSVGSTVTGFTQDSTTSGVSITTLTVGSGGTVLTASAAASSAKLTVSSITGTGNVTFDNDTTVSNGITVSSSVDNAGTITNSGTNSGQTLLSGGVGSLVTGITENSTTSALSVGALTVNSTVGTTLTNSSGTAKLSVTGGVTGSGDLVLDNDSATTGGITFTTAAVDNGGSITNSGTSSGSVTLTTGVGSAVTSIVENSATSTLSLGGANTTFAGSVTVTTGTLALIASSPSALNSANLVTVNNGGTFNIAGNSVTIAGIDDVSGSGGIVTNSSSASTLTIGGSGTYSYAGVINANTPANLALAITGGGTQTLSGANTYAGATTISTGTVNVENTSGSATGAGAVGVGSSGIITGGNNSSGATTRGGATLATYAAGVQGIISGTLTINSGGQLTPGNGGVGTISTAALTLNSGAILNYEFSNTANDLTAVTGSGGLTLSGGGINLYQAGTTTAFDTVGTYNILSYTGALGGSLNNLSVLNEQSGFNYAFSNDSTDDLIQLQITAAVPEPGTLSLMLMGGLALLAFWRRSIFQAV